MSQAVKDKPRGVQQRYISLRAASGGATVDTEARTVRFPFSSEEPIDMGWGIEILKHNPESIRIGTRQDNLPLLYNHNRDDLLGRVEKIDLVDARLYCTVRFGRDARGDWAMQQVADGILINCSFMYMEYKSVHETGSDIHTCTDWEIYEISLVTIPADATVGVGRAAAEPGDVKPTEPLSTPAEKATEATPQKGNTMQVRHILQDKANDGTTGGSGGAGIALTVDENRIRQEAAVAERERVNEIRSMFAKLGLDSTLRDKLIGDGTPIELARGLAINEMAKRNEQKPLTSLSDDIGLNEKEKRSYSLMRAIGAAASGDWSDAGFEREVSQTIAKRNQRELSGPNGASRFLVPSDLPFCPTEEHRRAYWAMQRSVMAAQQRAIYQVGTAAQGGNLVATNLLADSFIEVLRNMTVTSVLGATHLPGLVGKVAIPRQISATSTYWVGESGALTEAEATFDQVSLQPRTVGALSKVSRLMLLQSTPAIEMLTRRDLLSVGALAIDLAALSGPGTGNQPTGIINQSGVASVIGGTNGAALTFDHIIQLKYQTKVANAPQAASGFALNSKTIGFLGTLKATTGQYLWDPQGGLTSNSPDRLKGSPYAESQQLRSNLTKGASSGVCSELIYGANWQELLIGEWGVMEIAVNPYDSTGFANGDVVLRMFQTIDIGVRHGAAFAVMSDALTTGF